MKIAIVTTTIREGRNSIKVANWVLDNAKKYNDKVLFEIVDLKDYQLPIFGSDLKETDNEVINTWKNKINEYDGYIFITAEYNHSLPGVFKNALDYLKMELKEKVISFVGYGGIGGGRSIEQLKLIVSTFSSITTGISVNFFINTDFINFKELNAKDYHVGALNGLLDETIRWTDAFIKVRNK